MSGGHFNDCGYVYYKVSQFADELNQEIENDFINDEWGYHQGHSPEVIDFLNSYVPQLQKTSEIMKAIDYLYSGDHGDSSFMDRVKQIEKKYNDPIQQILDDPEDTLNEKIANALRESEEIWSNE